MSMPSFIAHDWLRKISAFIFAVLVYVSISLQLSEERTIERTIEHVKVNVEVAPANSSDIVILTEKEIFTNLKLRGSDQDLNSITNNQIEIKHLINSNRDGVYNFRITADQVSLPSGVSLVTEGIMPNKFTVNLDRKIERADIPIRLRFSTENLPNDKEIRKTSIQPNTARIVGPSIYVNDVDEVVTEVLALDGNSGNTYIQNLNLIDMPRITINPSKVQASVELRQSSDTRLYNDIPVQLMRGAGNLSEIKVDDSLVKVTLEGTTDELEQLSKNDFRAFVMLDEGAPAGPYKLPVLVWIRNDKITLRNVSPTRIDVQVLPTQPE